MAVLAGQAASPLYAQDTTAPINGPPANPASSTNVDTAGPPRDTTVAPAGQAGSRPDGLARDTTAPPAPVDSVLAAACRETGGEPPDLLTVVFRPTATAGERERAARDVGGTLLVQSRHQVPGAWYVRVPGSGINPHAADRLILQPPVLEVGATRCPS